MLRHLRVTVEGHAYDVTVEDLTDTGNLLYPDHRSMAPTAATAPVTAPTTPPATPSPGAQAAPESGSSAGDAGASGAVAVRAPMSGVVVEISVAPGDAVQDGQVVAVMEAMKLKSPIVVDTAGSVASVDVEVGDAVESGATILTLS